MRRLEHSAAVVGEHRHDAAAESRAGRAHRGGVQLQRPALRASIHPPKYPPSSTACGVSVRPPAASTASATVAPWGTSTTPAPPTAPLSVSSTVPGAPAPME